jgi:hypothetical protein
LKESLRGNRGTSAECDYLLGERDDVREGWDVRIFIAAAIVLFITGSSALAQTQPTRPSAYRTFAKDGTPVDVTLDLEGNIYFELNSRLYIRIYPPHLTR